MNRRTAVAPMLLTVACVAPLALWALPATTQDRLPAAAGRIGREVGAAEIAAADVTVLPDGTGLPPGRGTAREGRSVYQTQCAMCHGPSGEGTVNYPALVGGRGTLATSHPVPTVGSYWPYATTLWDYNRRAMPYPQPGTLTTTDVYAVTAFVLYLNDIIGEDQVLDETTLPRVKMPNRDGFVQDSRPDVTRVH